MRLPEVGDRIRLIHMPEDHDPIRPGETGTVIWVEDGLAESKLIGMEWDNGRSLSLCIPPDKYEILS